MTKQYYSTTVEDCCQTADRGKGNACVNNRLEIRLNDGETMYVNVDSDGWVEIRFSDNMKKVIKANADYFASYYRG